MIFKRIAVIFLIWFTLIICHGQTKSITLPLSGYHFCGPGTDFLERIARGQLGTNKLDEACRLHDLVYKNTKDFKLRMEADLKLEAQAWERVIAEDSSYKEKFAAWLVTNIIKLKHMWDKQRLQQEFGIKLSNLSSSVKNHDVQSTTARQLGFGTDYNKNYTEIETKNWSQVRIGNL